MRLLWGGDFAKEKGSVRPPVIQSKPLASQTQTKPSPHVDFVKRRKRSSRILRLFQTLCNPHTHAGHLDPRFSTGVGRSGSHDRRRSSLGCRWRSSRRRRSGGFRSSRSRSRGSGGGRLGFGLGCWRGGPAGAGLAVRVDSKEVLADGDRVAFLGEVLGDGTSFGRVDCNVDLERNENQEVFGLEVDQGLLDTAAKEMKCQPCRSRS